MIVMNMKLYLFIAFFLGLLPLRLFALQGNIQNGLYIDNHKGFRVAIPFSTNVVNHRKVYYVVSENNGGVQFELSRGYWMEGGRYAVIWLNCRRGVRCATSNAWFRKFAPTGARQIVQNLRMTFTSGKFISVNGNMAYQFAAQGTIQGMPALMLETDINYAGTGAIGMATLYTPLKNAINDTAYRRFVFSLQRLPYKISIREKQLFY